MLSGVISGDLHHLVLVHPGPLRNPQCDIILGHVLALSDSGPVKANHPGKFSKII